METVSALPSSQKQDAGQYSETDQPCRPPHTSYVFKTHFYINPRVPRGILDNSSPQDPVLLSAYSATYLHSFEQWHQVWALITQSV